MFPESVVKEGDSHTPLKGSVELERENPGTQTRAKRAADGTLSKHGGRYHKPNFDNICEVPGKWKPLQRLTSPVDQILKEGLNQGLAHSAKALIPALNLGSGGCAGHCTFLLGTVMQHVQVCRLMLKDPGTPAVAVALEWSEYLPLLSRSCCDRYFASDDRHPKETARFKGTLYGNKLGEEHGVRAFAKVMNSPHGTLFRLEHPYSCSGVTSLLGSGTFGVVLATKKNDEVLKLSRYGQMHDLLHEVSFNFIVVPQHKAGQ